MLESGQTITEFQVGNYAGKIAVQLNIYLLFSNYWTHIYQI